MTLTPAQQEIAAQQQMLDAWLRTPEGMAALQAATQSTPTVYTPGITRGDDANSGATFQNIFGTPYGQMRYLPGSNELISNDKFWWDGYGDPLAERSTYGINPDGTLGPAAPQDTSGGGESWDYFARFLGTAALGAGAAAYGGAAGGGAAGGGAAGGGAAGGGAAGGVAEGAAGGGGLTYGSGSLAGVGGGTSGYGGVTGLVGGTGGATGLTAGAGGATGLLAPAAGGGTVGAGGAAATLGGASTLANYGSGGGSEAGSDWWKTGSDLWDKYGGSVLGGIGGYLANMDPISKTSTTQNQITDPTWLAARDSALGNLSGIAAGNGFTPSAYTGFSDVGYNDVGYNNWSAAQVDGGYMNVVKEYLDKSTENIDATKNALAYDNNPYLTAMIESGNRDMRDNYAQLVAPKFSSGSSFGNSGLGFLEVMDRDNLVKRSGDLSNQYRFQDYNQRAQLLESLAGRQDTLNAGARNNFLQAGNVYGNQNFQLGNANAQLQNQALNANANGALQAAIANSNGALNAGMFNERMGFDVYNQNQLNQLTGQGQQIQAGNSIFGAPHDTTQTVTEVTQGNPWAGAVAGAVLGGNAWGAPAPSTQQKVAVNPWANVIGSSNMWGQSA